MSLGWNGEVKSSRRFYEGNIAPKEMFPCLYLQNCDIKAEVQPVNAMTDLKSARAIWLKGILFVLLGTTSAAMLLLESPTVRTALLLALAIWAFCRAYYFAFYVIEHYVDPTCRFSGLGSFVRYAFSKKKPR